MLRVRVLSLLPLGPCHRCRCFHNRYHQTQNPQARLLQLRHLRFHLNVAPFGAITVVARLLQSPHFS